MHIRLILSPSVPPVTGAAIYDRRMVQALTEIGHVAETRTEPDVPEEVRVLVDDSALQAIPAEALGRVTALVHHPVSLETDPPDQALKAQETALFGAARRIVTTSEQTAEALVAGFRVPPDKVTAIPPGIDEAPRSEGSGGPGCRILCLGQLIPRKGQDVLLRALARLPDLDWRLVVGGGANDPVYAEGLRALTAELGVADRVEFIGEVTGEPLEALWRSADLFALTSHYEGYGMVYAEALRRGLPVAATNVGVVPSLIGPECGAVCAPGDVEQMSKALRRLIFDTALRRDVADAAWQAGRMLPSWKDQATKLAAVLEEQAAS